MTCNDPRCLWCGQRLFSYTDTGRVGTFGDEAFCSMTCGYRMAVANKEALSAPDAVNAVREIALTFGPTPVAEVAPETADT